MAAPRAPEVRIAVQLLTILMGALALFQLALALGAPLGRAAWGGAHEVLPMHLRVGSLVSIATYALVVWVVRRRAARPDVRGFRVATYALAAYFALGVLLNLASSSPWERFLMAPVALVLAACCFLVASRAG